MNNNKYLLKSLPSTPLHLVRGVKNGLGNGVQLLLITGYSNSEETVISDYCLLRVYSRDGLMYKYNLWRDKEIDELFLYTLSSRSTTANTHFAQFYNKYVCQSRADKSHYASVRELALPISSSWLANALDATLIVNGGISLAYTNLKTNKRQLADMYLCHFSLRNSYGSGPLSELLPLFLSENDYDNIIDYKGLDVLDNRFLSMFDINNEYRYLGDDINAVVAFLKAVTSLRNGMGEYIGKYCNSSYKFGTVSVPVYTDEFLHAEDYKNTKRSVYITDAVNVFLPSANTIIKSIKPIRVEDVPTILVPPTSSLSI